MRLDTEFVKLPLRFEAERLAAEVLAVPEADWRPHPQGHPGNSALPLVAAHGDPTNDATKGPMRPTRHLAAMPYLRQVLASFATVLGRTRLMRLDGNAEATAHTDTNYYWLERVRIHVPVLTRPEVEFQCGDRALHMAAGEAWVFDTWKRHNVLNPNPTRRIHLVADSVGSAAFWDLVAGGERPFGDGGTTPAPPQRVDFQPGQDPELRFESNNQPIVMSPWEQEVLLGWLSTDLARSEAPQAGLVAELGRLLLRFRRDWRAAWARFGESAAGWPRFRALRDELDAALRPYAGRLRLPNGNDAVEIARQMVVRPGLNPELAAPGEAAPAAIAPVVAVPAPAAAPDVSSTPAAPRFDRPIFVVSPPRSGSSLLFETLAQSPTVWTIGGESHAVIERLPGLHPKAKDFASNRLTAEDATPAIVDQLTARFVARLRDRNGRRPAPGATALRLLEKTPKNALRVPFLAAAYPDARFVYLYRDPRETLSSMLDAWRSGRFVTYPQLPGWEGDPWSLLLVPGWQELAGKPLREVVARQWETATRLLLDDLEALPAGRWCLASYERLASEPQAEIARLAEFLALDWDRALTAPLPPSRSTLTSPDPDKWRHNQDDLQAMLPLVARTAERARDLFAHPPAVRPARHRAPAEAPGAAVAVQPNLVRPAAAPGASPAAAGGATHPFRSSSTQTLPRLLGELGISLLVSTYQSGRVVVVRADQTELNTHFRGLPSPMGIAVGRDYLAIGTQREVVEFRNQPAVGRKLPPVGKHDACFLPRGSWVTGDIRIHELAFAGDELWLVNTRFSCLCQLDRLHSFVPRWRPPFVSGLAAEDRCHLNGMAIADGRVAYVTALGATDTPQGWRERKADGGVLVDVASGEILLGGLSMPHSPRVHDGKLYLLESGKGTLARADLATGTVTTLAELPGFTRGLAFAGPFAFVGLSQVRESNIFGGIPLSERVKEKQCGVWVVDLRNGRTVGFLRFEEAVQEIFDVQVLSGIRFPELAEPGSDLLAGAFVLPDEALREVASRRN